MDLPVEQHIPFDIEILHHDEHLLVVDKPHFLATTPRGSWVTETALVRLRRQLGNDDLAPMHRLDRLTAGVLVFTVDPAVRGRYQRLFQSRSVAKEYEAIARFDPALPFPITVSSRIVKHRSVLQAEEVAGEPNAETTVELVEQRGRFARYRLLPHTGKTHQLRVHLNSLGIPIVGDPLYPVVRAHRPDDFTDPLRLLARRITFEGRTFTSRRSLDLNIGLG